jgi:hypothetical protein
VLVSATVNNCALRILWLNLLHFNSYNYKYSLHRFTTHKPKTLPLVRYHFTSYLIVRTLAASLLLTLLALLALICSAVLLAHNCLSDVMQRLLVATRIHVHTAVD